MPPPKTLLLLLLTTTCTPIPTQATNTPTDTTIEIPLQTATGETTQIQARFCRPNTPGPARLVVINHGSPANAADRPAMRPAACTAEPVAWFLGRGDAVLLPLRRGYGATGGPFAETTGPCNTVDYAKAGRETARDIQAAVDWGVSQPGIRPDHVVVLGQSAGGWGAVALDSLPHPHVSAIISMAGGRGGHMDLTPNRNCHPNLLAQAAATYGATATTPMLWVYTANDSFFAPEIATSLHEAFTQAGGKATLLQLGPVGRDGHGLFNSNGGSQIWGPLIARYLAQTPGN